jgi:hypothetical protein
VSANLPDWIDLIWGLNQTGENAEQTRNTYDPLLYETVWELDQGKDEPKRPMIEAMLQHCGHMPPKLFANAHPQRMPRNSTIPLRSVRQLMFKPYNLQFVCVSQMAKQTYKVSGVTNTRVFVEFTDSISEVQSFTPVVVGTAGSVLLSRTGILNGFNLFALTPSGGFVEVNLKNGETRFLGGHIGRVNCMASGGEWIASGGTDTTTNIWSMPSPSTPFYSVTTSRDEVVACAVGENFGIVASATRDGSIFLIVIGTGATAHVLSIKETPVLLMVTPGWGFVLVHSTKIVDAIAHFYLTLFSINGDLIRKCEIPFGLQAWTTWESRKGFDYVAAIGSDGDLVVFEAFFLELGIPFGRMLGKIIMLKMFVDEELLFVVSETQFCVYSSLQMKLDLLEKFQFGSPAEPSTDCVNKEPI